MPEQDMAELYGLKSPLKYVTVPESFSFLSLTEVCIFTSKSTQNFMHAKFPIKITNSCA